MTTHIVALEKDLFFAVKIRDTLQPQGMRVTIARTLPVFEQHLASEEDDRPALVIVNTGTSGVDWVDAIRKARAAGFLVLAFGSHMDLDARAKALEAGAQRVVANSKFASDMVGLVQRMLASPETQQVPE